MEFNINAQSDDDDIFSSYSPLYNVDNPQTTNECNFYYPVVFANYYFDKKEERKTAAIKSQWDSSNQTISTKMFQSIESFILSEKEDNIQELQPNISSTYCELSDIEINKSDKSIEEFTYDQHHKESEISLNERKVKRKTNISNSSKNNKRTKTKEENYQLSLSLPSSSQHLSRYSLEEINESTKTTRQTMKKLTNTDKRKAANEKPDIKYTHATRYKKKTSINSIHPDGKVIKNAVISEKDKEEYEELIKQNLDCDYCGNKTSESEVFRCRDKLICVNCAIKYCVEGEIELVVLNDYSEVEYDDGEVLYRCERLKHARPLCYFIKKTKNNRYNIKKGNNNQYKHGNSCFYCRNYKKVEFEMKKVRKAQEAKEEEEEIKEEDENKIDLCCLFGKTNLSTTSNHEKGYNNDELLAFDDDEYVEEEDDYEEESNIY